MSAETAERQLRRQIRAAHPRLREAVVADALTTMRFRGEGQNFDSRLDALRHIVRLAWCSDAFLGQVLYRIKARMLAAGIPLVPRIAHRLAMTIAQISIGDPVVVEPGIYIIHGQVVVDGLVRIGAGTVLAPFVTIGLRAGDFNGPTLERGVQVGTGAKIIGRCGSARARRSGLTRLSYRMWSPATPSFGSLPAACRIRAVRLPWRRRDEGATAVAEPPEPELPSRGQLRSEIDELSEANRADPDPDRERAILRVRHLAGIRLVDEAPTAPQFPDAGGWLSPRATRYPSSGART